MRRRFGGMRRWCQRGRTRWTIWGRGRGYGWRRLRGRRGPRFLKVIDDCHRRVAKHAPFWFVDFIEQRARFEGVVVQGPVEEPDAIFLQIVAQLPLPDLG